MGGRDGHGGPRQGVGLISLSGICDGYRRAIAEAGQPIAGFGGEGMVRNRLPSVTDAFRLLSWCRGSSASACARQQASLAKVEQTAITVSL